MPLLAQLGLHFDAYGEGFVEATWTPTELACNPVGGVHGGVYGVIFDAAMNFAVNSALESGDRGSTLELSYQIVRAPEAGCCTRGALRRRARGAKRRVRRGAGHRRGR